MSEQESQGWLKVAVGCPAAVSAVFLLLLFLLPNCDVVTSRYPTRKDAENDQLFERGWLPPIIPKTSARIVTKNDLDVDTSSGSFLFDPREYGEFIAKLKPYSGQETGWNTRLKKDVARYEGKGFKTFEYTYEDGTWIFHVHPTEGRAEYFMWSR